MTSKELENFIFEYVGQQPIHELHHHTYHQELIKAAMLVGEEDPFALASYLESMCNESRKTFFDIVRINRDKERNRDKEGVFYKERLVGTDS